MPPRTKFVNIDTHVDNSVNSRSNWYATWNFDRTSRVIGIGYKKFGIISKHPILWKRSDKCFCAMLWGFDMKTNYQHSHRKFKRNIQVQRILKQQILAYIDAKYLILKHSIAIRDENSTPWELASSRLQNFGLESAL